MNYYPHHIGDFNSATRHLSRIERSLYRDMIDMYYDTEQPLTADFKLLCRKLMARTEEEVTGVEQVLNEFFTQSEQGWIHARCEQVIAEYREQLEKKSAAGKASAEARAAAKAAAEAAKTQGSATDDEQALNNRSTNQEPRTINHKPETKGKAEKQQRASRLSPDWTPSEQDIEYCKTNRPELQVQQVAINFRDYWLGSGKTKVDWSATWRTWVRNEKQQARASPGYQTREDKTKAFADALTGNRNDQRYPADQIIDIN